MTRAMVTTLVDAGADLSAQHRLRGTALHVAAAFNENPDMIRVLAASEEVEVATLGERLQREARNLGAPPRAPAARHHLRQTPDLTGLARAGKRPCDGDLWRPLGTASLLEPVTAGGRR